MEVHGWRGARRKARGWDGRRVGSGLGGKMEESETGGRVKMDGSETGGAWVGREEGREWEAHMGVDGAGEGRWRAWLGCGRGWGVHGCGGLRG